LRWCQGNMQYWRFLVVPGLPLISRCQLALAILMFVGSPAWIGILLVGTAAVVLAGSGAAFIHVGAGSALFAVVLVMWFAPKIATLLDILSRPSLRRAAGGTGRILAGMAAETVFSLLLSPIMWLAHTIFLGRVVLVGTTGWTGHVRDDHQVPWPRALQHLWPHTLLGVGTIAVLAATVPAAIPYALLIAAGPLLAIPLAVATASPEAGRLLVRLGIGRLPEETSPPPELKSIMLPAPEAAGGALRSDS
jgi:membrane glycosyltransferase